MLPCATFLCGAAVTAMPEKKRDIEPEDLAKRVLALIDARKRIVASTETHQNVCTLANAFLLIDQLLEKFEGEIRERADRAGLAQFGFVDAKNLMDALQTGAPHPIFSFVEGIREPRKRGSKIKLSTIDKLYRAKLIGLVHAYREAR